MVENVPYEEYREILNSLANHHAVFYQFWRLVKPKYTQDEIDTACVVFNREADCVDFLINKSFWQSLSENNRKFVICHECMHVINSHGKRMGKFKNNIDQANCAMDIVVNESLVKYFGFSRKEFDSDSKYIWLDKVFPNNKSVLKDNSFEYYFNLMLKENDFSSNGKLINDHKNLKNISSDFAQEIIDQLSDEDTETLSNIAERSELNSKNADAGKGSNGLIKNLQNKSPHRKSKWETIIKKFVKKFSKDEADEYHWLFKDKRMRNLSKSLFLPSEIEYEFKKSSKEKIQTWFFMDTSGSCEHLAQRFFDAASSINPDKFDVEYYCFDTSVFNVNLKDKKLQGFGGTSFRAISDFIYKKKNQTPYVWVLTDGMGDYPNIPEKERSKWSWFLTEDSNNRYIPKNCKIYDLKNFE